MEGTGSGRLRMVAIRWLVLLLALAWPLSNAPAGEKQARIEDFFGTYEGEAIADNEAGLTVRDIGVVIQPLERGFNITWTTLKRGADDENGEKKRKTYSINFSPTTRDGVFASAMRTDLFGKSIPLDPFKGDPFVWAAMRGETLTVYALHITDDAGYELETYDRTLTDTGLHLELSRVRKGLHLKYIAGELTRTGQ